MIGGVTVIIILQSISATAAWKKVPVEEIEGQAALDV